MHPEDVVECSFEMVKLLHKDSKANNDAMCAAKASKKATTSKFGSPKVPGKKPKGIRRH